MRSVLSTITLGVLIYSLSAFKVGRRCAKLFLIFHQCLFLGLEGAIFCLLDRESDHKLIADARDLLSHIVQAVALENLGFWVELCKSVLAASTG